MNHDEFVTYDAAYVLGALSPADRHAYEQHLRGCAACAQAVREVAGMPGLLARVPLAELPAVDADSAAGEAPPDTLLPALLARVERNGGERLPGTRRWPAAGRRPWMWRRWGLSGIPVAAALAGAACLLAVILVVLPGSGGTGAPGSRPGGDVVAMTQVTRTPLHATAQLQQVAWGTRIDVHCWYDLPGASAGREWGPYALVVTDTDGDRQQVATWNAVAGRTITVDGSTALRPEQIASVDIRVPGGRPMLSMSP